MARLSGYVLIPGPSTFLAQRSVRVHETLTGDVRFEGEYRVASPCCSCVPALAERKREGKMITIGSRKKSHVQVLDGLEGL